MKAFGPVLIVDDDLLYLECMCSRLIRRNLAVEKALSGREALEKLGSNPEIGVVVMDVAMPGMDGLTALGRIKQHFPTVEVIMMSGRGMVEDALEGIKLGAFDYLLKPCDMQELLSKVEQAGQKRLGGEN